MYRKTLLLLTLLLALSIQSQNLQLHHDMRSSIYGKENFDNNYTTATFEIFHPDRWGATFMFVDADFNLSDGNVGMMYTEISRTFKINNFPVLPLIEYNGGLGLIENDDDISEGYLIPNAYLVGLSYPLQLGKLFIDTYVAYKYNAFKEVSHDVQWTVTWTTNLFDNKLTLSGFADLWTENRNQLDASSNKKIIFLAEPQIWYNLNTHLALGSEVRMSSNFVSSKVYVCPTIGAKWSW